MGKKTLDSMDNRIIRLLREDGRMSVSDMAKRLHVTTPTVRSRLKNLREAGLLKICGLIDPDRHAGFSTALVAMSIRSHGEMDQILKKIADLENVVWAGVVAGRYDIIAEIVFKGGTAGRDYASSVHGEVLRASTPIQGGREGLGSDGERLCWTEGWKEEENSS
jgi:Lrp/AsnC family transcriptional regulator for asnA, asnC and gidA